MATLSKRATPRQKMVMRMIEGACRNAAHAHPDMKLTDRHVRGIAKRAAGTLTSQWRGVLAAPLVRPEGGDGQLLNHPTANGRYAPSAVGKRTVTLTASRLRGASQFSWRAPLRLLHRAIGNAAGEARREGSADREEAFKDVLRLLTQIIQADEMPNPRTKLKVKS